jgi:hypothetical protein
MKAATQLFAILFALVVVFGLGVAWEISLWNECRSTKSVWYCMRVLGK